jgi:uncharacterized membrane protein
MKPGVFVDWHTLVGRSRRAISDLGDRPRGTVHATRRGSEEDMHLAAGAGVGERSARALGYFSVGLGALEIAAPGLVARAMGMRGGGVSSWILRGFGVREVTAGMAILGQRRPGQWLWARAAGDVMDMTFAASGLLSSRNHRGRVLASLVALAGVTALDLQTAEQLDGAGIAGSDRMLRGITVNRSMEEVERFWREFSNRAETSPELRYAQFAPAPGNRGTEIRVEEPLPKLGFGNAFARMTGKSVQQRVQADLRRAKQLIETGEITLSDATREGEGLLQAAGQPRGEHAASGRHA